MFLFGKWLGRPLMVTSAPSHVPSRLFYVTDQATGLCFLVNIEAEVSSVSNLNHCKKNLCLQAVNNILIATYGNRLLTLNIGLRCTFQWVFIIANVKNPIIGADFLHHYSLLVNVGHNRLVDNITQLQVQGVAVQDVSSNPTLLVYKHSTTVFETILLDYPDIVRPCTTEQPVKHNVTHYVYPYPQCTSTLNVSRQQSNILNSCSNRGSSDHHPVAGNQHYTWSLSKVEMLLFQICRAFAKSGYSKCSAVDLNLGSYPIMHYEVYYN